MLKEIREGLVLAKEGVEDAFNRISECIDSCQACKECFDIGPIEDLCDYQRKYEILRIYFGLILMSDDLNDRKSVIGSLKLNREILNDFYTGIVGDFDIEKKMIAFNTLKHYDELISKLEGGQE